MCKVELKGPTAGGAAAPFISTNIFELHFWGVLDLGSRVWPKRKNRGPREAQPRDSSIYIYIYILYIYIHTYIYIYILYFISLATIWENDICESENVFF